MKKFLFVILSFLLFLGNFMFSQKVKDFEIIPSGSGDKAQQIVNNIINSEDGVIEAYKQEAQELGKKCENLGTARASGVFDRNLILCYFKYLIKFLSQIGLVIGALMIIYAGYLYASAVFAGSNPQKGATAVKNAILGVLIIIISYAILKILVAMFL